MGATKQWITHGPWGGSEGEDWDYMPQGFIRKIIVRSGEVIDSIKFQTFNSLGETQASVFGGPGGNRTDTICVDYPEEYLISIRGTFASYHGFNVVNSICFVTNLNQYGPYGTDSGTAFWYCGKGGVIVGFHGLVDKYLSSIGVYVVPESLAFRQSFTCDDELTHELGSCMSRMVMPRNAGPWGTDAGRSWDDGVFSTVKHVRIYLGQPDVFIYAVQFVYLKKDGKTVLSPIRGGTGASKVEMVNLDGEDEYLTGISGVYIDHREIRSISFHTNKQTYGPYGEKTSPASSVKFTSISTSSPGKVVGFHGWSADGYLSRIGVHMEYF